MTFDLDIWLLVGLDSLEVIIEGQDRKSRVDHHKSSATAEMAYDGRKADMN